MKTNYLLILFPLFIITTMPLETSENPMSSEQLTQSTSLLQQTKRNLQQIQHQVQYALEIPGFQYAGLFFYLLAFRIVGMQNLIIFQVVQLYQQSMSQTDKVYFNIGNFIHGYSNPSLFALQGFGYGFVFNQINLVWEISVLLFLIVIAIKHIVAPWYKNKILHIKEQNNRKIQIELNPVIFEPKQSQGTESNLIEQKNITKNMINFNQNLEIPPKDTQSTIRHGNKMTQSKFSLLSRKDTIKENNETSIVKRMVRSSIETANGQNMRNFSNKIKQTQSFMQQVQTPNNKVGPNEQRLQKKQANKIISKYYKTYKKTLLYSNIVLKQVIFYTLINSLPITGYSVIKEIQQRKDLISSLKMSFSGCMITISSLVMFLYTLKIILEKTKGSGETKTKFVNFTYANKVFWLITIAERIAYSLLLGSDWNYAIAAIFGLKLVVMVVAKFVNVWMTQADYYRNLVVNFIHLLVFIVLTLDQYYFSTVRKVNLSKESIALILLSLLALSFAINFVFFFKDTGIFGWISKKLKFNPNSSVKNTALVLDPSPINDILHNDETDHSKRVKFIEAKPIELTKQQEGSVIISSRKTQKSTENVGCSRKSLNTLKSIGTLYQSEIKPSINSSVSNSQKQVSSRITVKSQSSIQKGTIPSSKESQTFTNLSKNHKLETRTHKQINKVINDALRAQKTHNVIFEETSQNDYEDNEDADVVSIQMDHHK